MLKAWMRDLQIIFSSNLLKQSIVFGSNWKNKEDDFDIKVTGTKYLSSLKDSFTIQISNLTYSEIIKLNMGKYYQVEIKAGYRTTGAQTIFKGEVIYMSNKYNSDKSTTLIVLCGSKLVAKYGQSRLNLSLKSGLNMYSALNFICKRAGITNSNIDEDFKNKIIRETTSVQNSVGSFLDVFTKSNSFVVNSDSSIEGADVNILDPYRSNNRVINLDSSKISLTGGYPTLNADGLSMTLLPTFNFMPMDVIVIDNSIIDLSVSSNNPSNFNNSMFLDEDGKYMITEISYNLENRGSNFSLDITARARSLYSKLKGGLK